MTATDMRLRSELYIAQRATLAMIKSASLAAQRACIGHRLSRNNAERRFYFRAYVQFQADWRSARTEFVAISAELTTLDG